LGDEGKRKEAKGGKLGKGGVASAHQKRREKKKLILSSNRGRKGEREWIRMWTKGRVTEGLWVWWEYKSGKRKGTGWGVM